MLPSFLTCARPLAVISVEQRLVAQLGIGEHAALRGHVDPSEKPLPRSRPAPMRSVAAIRSIAHLAGPDTYALTRGSRPPRSC